MPWARSPLQVRRAIEDLQTLVRNYPRENQDMPLDEKEVVLFVRHCSKNMYNAILTCTLRSLQVSPGAGQVH